MSCCGSKRNEYKRVIAVQRTSATTDNPPAAVKVREDALFEYAGLTGLTVTGSVTGNMYHFTQNGGPQFVDYRDAGEMMGNPLLKRVYSVTE